MFFYGVEGAGVGNDTSTVSALSAVPFVVHVESTERDGVLDHLKDDLGVITITQYNDFKNGKLGIVAVASLSNPDEAGNGNYNISLLAREQLEILAKLAGGTGSSADGGIYSGVSAKKVTITLANGKKIIVIASVFVK